MDLDSVTQNNVIIHAFAEPLPSLEISMEFRGFHCHFHGVFGLHFHGLPKNSENLVHDWVASICYAFYKFPWIPQIISVESMEQSDSISMESTQCFLLMSMQPWMPWKAMEKVEFYRIPRKPWNLICLRIDINCWENGLMQEWNLHFKYNIYHKCCKKSCLIYLVELKYKTKDNLIPN